MGEGIGSQHSNPGGSVSRGGESGILSHDEQQEEKVLGRYGGFSLF